MASKLTTTEYVAIIGLALAAYGAILSTINSIIQLITHRRDRADVVLKVRKNMSFTGPQRYVNVDYDNMKFTVITATNRGKRPVTIQSFATTLLDSHDEYLLRDIQPPVPREVTEGQSVSAFVDQAGNDLAPVECYYIWDSVGRHFRINMAPWHRRIISRFRRRFAPVNRVEKVAISDRHNRV
jgi:hypothetical protein